MRSTKMYDVTRQTERNRASEFGRLYQVFYKVSIPAGESRNLLHLTNDKRVYSYPTVIATSKDKITFQFFEDTEYTGGDPVSIFNHNRVINTPSTHTMLSGVTVTDEGLQVAQAFLPGAEGQGQIRTGTVGGGGDLQWLLKPNTAYLSKFTNGSNQANEIQVNEIWIEV